MNGHPRADALSVSRTPSETTIGAKSGIAAARGQGGAPQAVTVSLPLPPKECHQNWRGSQMVRAKMRANHDARWDAQLAAQEAMGGNRVWQPAFFARCAADVTFRFPDRRRRDISNYLGAIKPYFDGFCDAGLYDDDAHVVEITVRGMLDRANPGVQITVRPIEDEHVV